VSETFDLGPTGGAVWADDAEWSRRRTPEGCIICVSGAPLDVIAETASCWVTAPADAPLPGYVCVVSKEHVCEPFELEPETQAAFWRDSMAVAAAISEVEDLVKMNYEIHGNTLPHLHLHLFPRQRNDPYVGGPIDPRMASFHRPANKIAAIESAVRDRLAETTSG
jgi:diadenosine tetraphosphate (Ap4A) HIT family hydrolase